MVDANAQVREWAVRLAADDQNLSALSLNTLSELAQTETDPSVLVQIAASAKRLPRDQCLRVCQALLNRDLATDDPYLPLVLWWAVEKQCDDHEALEAALVNNEELYVARCSATYAPRIVERAGMIGGDVTWPPLLRSSAPSRNLPTEVCAVKQPRLVSLVSSVPSPADR